MINVNGKIKNKRKEIKYYIDSRNRDTSIFIKYKIEDAEEVVEALKTIIEAIETRISARK